MKLIGKDKEFSDPFKFADFTKSPKDIGSVHTTGQYYNKLLKEKESWQNALRVGKVSQSLKEGLHRQQETETSVLPFMVNADSSINETYR